MCLLSVCVCVLGTWIDGGLGRYAGVLLGVVSGASIIVRNFRNSGLPISRLLLTGGLPHAVPSLAQVRLCVWSLLRMEAVSRGI